MLTPTLDSAQQLTMDGVSSQDQEKNKILSKFFDLVKSQQKSFRQASVIAANGTPLSPNAIRMMARKRLASPSKSHKSQLLSDSEELVLAAVVDAHSILNMPFTRSEVKGLVYSAHPELTSHSLTSWYKNWFRKYKSKFSETTAKGLCAPRIAKETLSLVEQWVKEFPLWIDRHGLSWKSLVNVDETRVKINLNTSSARTLNTRRREKHSMTETRKGKFSSYIPFVSSEGDLIMDVFVVPLIKKAEIAFPLVNKRGCNSCNTFWTFSETGCVNATLWLEIFKEFKNKWQNLHPGLHPIILTDNLACHKSKEAIEFCEQYQLHVFYLPAGTTHFLNPLDDQIFTSFKKKISDIVTKDFSLLSAKQAGLPDAVLEAAQSARDVLSRNVIKAAFKNVGIFPFNSKVILKNAKINVGEIENDQEHTKSAIDLYTSLAIKRLNSALADHEKKSVKLSVKRLKKKLIFTSDEILKENLAEIVTKADNERKHKLKQDERKDKKLARNIDNEMRKALQKNMHVKEIMITKKSHLYSEAELDGNLANTVTHSTFALNVLMHNHLLWKNMKTIFTKICKICQTCNHLPKRKVNKSNSMKNFHNLQQ
jgi:hypothetical protein